jgi:hypothetical protein
LKLRALISGGLVFLFVGLLVNPFGLALTVVRAVGSGGNSYPSGSWGLGIVVPDGSQYADGTSLSWKNAREIEALVQLPHIEDTDNTIYAILSAMIQDGSVLQVAAGINPNMTSWLAYAFFAPNAQSQDYTLVLNSSKPEMTNGDSISLSIYLSAEHWNYQVDDIRTHESVQGRFMFNVTPSLKTGDQEIFALESYTRSNIVFEHMTSLVLTSLLINGMRVAKGWYYYGDWDSSHNPLFVVGGLNPPPFISVRGLDNSTVEWSYAEWTGSEQAFPYSWSVMILASFAVAGGITVSAVFFKVRNRSRGSRIEPRSPAG